MTAARPSTWMPMYWGDYLRDTGHLSTEQHGAYLLLIGHYWTTAKPLPDDDQQLARIARLPNSAWKKAKPLVAAFFIVVNGLWRHRRIDDELQKAVDFVAKQTANGKGGGRPSRNPDVTQPESQPKPNGNPEHKPKETTLPSSSPSALENPTVQLSSLDPAARAKKIAEAKEEVSRLLNSPTITLFNRVDAWIEQGADLERDIVPAIKAGLAKLGGAPRSLKWFDGFVADALAARTAPLGRGNPGGAKGPQMTAEEKETRQLETYAELIGKGRPPGLSFSNVHRDKLLARGMVTEEQMRAAGIAVGIAA